MMICKADFEELFPALFQPEPCVGAPPEAAAPSAVCLARWEDDGGRFGPAEEGLRSAVDRNVEPDHPAIGFGLVAAPILATAAYGAAWQVAAADWWMAWAPRRSGRAAGSTGTGGDIRTAPADRYRRAEAPLAHR